MLLALNAMRVVPGAFMVLLALQGRLSGPFPQSAGWGDIIVGLTAIPLALAITHGIIFAKLARTERLMPA